MIRRTEKPNSMFEHKQKNTGKFAGRSRRAQRQTIVETYVQSSMLVRRIQWVIRDHILRI